jgi:hypothetical protein
VKRSRKVLISALAATAAATTALAIIFAPAGGAAHAATGGTAVLHAAHLMQIKGAKPGGGGSSNLYYHGGTSDGSSGTIGVETSPKLYLVFWGSQWGSCSGTTCSNDPSGEVGILDSFFSGVGGSSWNNTVTQYCQGLASGTYFCNGGGQAAGNPSGVLAGVLFDTGTAAPSRPTQTQLGNEAIRAAGLVGNNTTASNASTQYFIDTATGNNASGFGSRYCAWHSSVSSSAGDIAYTNMPYITDAGASCGANFNGLGANAGITIVGGHEFAETETDQYPNGGWLDSGGSEIGDKCAWISSGQGAAADVKLTTGSFPVQSLWSNAFNSDKGGCVLSF